MTGQQKNIVNKDLLIDRISRTAPGESKLVRKIIRQVKKTRKNSQLRLNVDEKQLQIYLSELIKKWEKAQISLSVNKFLTEIKASWKIGDNVILWGLFSSQIYRTPSRKAKNPQTGQSMIIKEKNRLRFRVSSKLKREINN
jgi:nucleoid DNA-binding protein